MDDSSSNTHRPQMWTNASFSLKNNWWWVFSLMQKRFNSIWLKMLHMMRTVWGWSLHSPRGGPFWDRISVLMFMELGKHIALTEEVAMHQSVQQMGHETPRWFKYKVTTVMLSDRTRTLWPCHHFQAVDVPAWHWLHPKTKGQPAVAQGAPTSLGGVCQTTFLLETKSNSSPIWYRCCDFQETRALMQRKKYGSRATLVMRVNWSE